MLHESSLRKIKLTNVHLLDGTCTDLFKSLSRKMPKLRQFQLCGLFTCEGEALWDFGHWWFAEPRNDVSIAMESYLRRGGPFPASQDLIDQHIHGVPGLEDLPSMERYHELEWELADRLEGDDSD